MHLKLLGLLVEVAEQALLALPIDVAIVVDLFGPFANLRARAGAMTATTSSAAAVRIFRARDRTVHVE